MKDHFSPGRTTKPLWCMLCAISPNKKKENDMAQNICILEVCHFDTWSSRAKMTTLWAGSSSSQTKTWAKYSCWCQHSYYYMCICTYCVSLCTKIQIFVQKMSLLGLVVSPVHVTFSVLRNSSAVSLVMPMLFLTCSLRLCFPFLPVLCSLS